MFSDKQNVILKLIRQHRSLQKELDLTHKMMMGNGESKYLIIVHLLGDFKKNLLEHVKLENEKFYDVLVENDEKGKAQAMEFRESMKGIEEVVLKFIDEYRNEEKLKSEFADFQNEFELMVSKLNSRISLEEVGVYSYWSMVI